MRMAQAYHKYRLPSTELTPREKEIKALIEAGHTTVTIAMHLNISFETVRRHRENIRSKLLSKES